jgi:hypothetical protein
MYSALPPQPQQQQQGNYVVSPLMNEYKAPLVGVYGSPSPTPGVVSPNTPPPGQHGYGFGGTHSPGPGMMNGRYEAPGEPVSAPVEAPNSWERGVQM